MEGLPTHRRLDWLLPNWLEDANAFDQSMDEDMASVGYTILVNVLLCIAMVLFFSFYRMVDPAIYWPKHLMMPEKTPPLISNTTPFNWIWELYEIDDDAIIATGGYDVLFLVRFYRLGFKIFFVFSFYAFGVILPINRTVGVTDQESGVNSFQIWSMTNIPQQSPRCWFHLIGMYLLTAITIYFLEKEFVVYAKHRHEYLRQRHARLRTVLVEGIPYKLRTTSTLATYFEALYPNSILHVRLAQDLRYLEQLISEREEAVLMLDRYHYIFHNSKERPTVKVGKMLHKVDAIKYYTQLVESLNEAVAKEQERARKLAHQEDKVSGSHAIEVIEEFLKVTKIGAIKKMLKEKTGSSKKWISVASTSGKSSKSFSGEGGLEAGRSLGHDPSLSSYQNSESSNSLHDSVDEEDKAEPELRYYRLSYGEWFWEIYSAPTFFDKWRAFKNGRIAESQCASVTESAALISSTDDRKMFLSKAFVTFKTFTAATIARQVIHMQLADHLAVSEAPEPTDILWRNMYSTRTGTFWRRLFVEMIVIFLNIVWVAPVTLVSYVVSEEALRSFFPFVDNLCEKSEWGESLVELIQPGALVAIMNLLPPILQGLAILEGYVSYSAIQFRVFDRYFFFQVINVFLVTTVAGSVIDCVRDIYYNPSDAFRLLGTSVPKMGAFFTNYIFVKAFTGLGMELMRFAALFIALLKYLFTSNLTPRDRRATPLFGSIRNILNPGWFSYAKIYAQDMLQFMACAVYANISPLILMAGLCYFAGAAYIYKHQLLYVYEPVYETGGKWWPKMARVIVVSLFFAQATLTGMFILKETYTEVYAMAFLIGVTTLYFWNMVKTYVPLANQLPFDMATSMDLDQQEFPNELAGAEKYIQPALRSEPVFPDLEFPIDPTPEPVNL